MACFSGTLGEDYFIEKLKIGGTYHYNIRNQSQLERVVGTNFTEPVSCVTVVEDAFHNLCPSLQVFILYFSVVS